MRGFWLDGSRKLLLGVGVSLAGPVVGFVPVAEQKVCERQVEAGPVLRAPCYPSPGYPSFLEPESGLEISKTETWGLFTESGHAIPSRK